MKMKRLSCAILLLTALVGFCRADDERVTPMVKEALRLYGDKQYIQALDLFKQVKRIDPNNSLADEYIEKTQKNIAEGVQGTGEVPPDVSPTWDSLLNSRKKPAADVNNAKDIIAARRSLVDKMKNRSTRTDNIVQIQDTKGGLQITLYHDQLFLPGLQILRDEALPILDNVAALIRQKGDKGVTIQSLARTNSTDPFLLYPDFPVPSADPTHKKETSFVFQDIEASRSFILFTYLAERSMGSVPPSALH